MKLIHIYNIECPPDCNDVRFDVIEMKTVQINPNVLCKHENFNEGIGYELSKMKMIDSGGYYPLVHEYLKSNQPVATREALLPLEIYKECLKIMNEDIAIVNVYFASNRFTKTVVDKRLSFGDKLSSFGK